MTKQGDGAKVAADRIADGVYLSLRTKIVEGRIRPNEMLFELEIADELGVSRSPVREALQRLVADGLVDLVRRRWIVHEFTVAEIEEIYLVRMAIEGYAAKHAAQAITPAQREELMRFREVFEMHRQGDLEQRVYRNNEFHDFIVQCSNSPRLTRYSDMNNTFHFNVNLALLYTRDDLMRSAQQHIEVIDSILAGDGDRAREVTEEHVLESLQMIRQKLFIEHKQEVYT